MTHTPTPWQKSHFVDGPQYNGIDNRTKAQWALEEYHIIRGPGKIGSPECNVVANVRNQDDIPLIVVAVNNHQALITQLLNLVNELRAGISDGMQITTGIDLCLDKAEQLLKDLTP